MVQSLVIVSVVVMFRCYHSRLRGPWRWLPIQQEGNTEVPENFCPLMYSVVPVAPAGVARLCIDW